MEHTAFTFQTAGLTGSCTVPPGKPRPTLKCDSLTALRVAAIGVQCQPSLQAPCHVIKHLSSADPSCEVQRNIWIKTAQLLIKKFIVTNFKIILENLIFKN